MNLTVCKYANTKKQGIQMILFIVELFCFYYYYVKCFGFLY